MASHDRAPGLNDRESQPAHDAEFRIFGDFLMPPMMSGPLAESRQPKKEREKVLAPVLDRLSLPFKALAEAARRRRNKK